MKRAIVITTSEHTKDFLEACIDSCLQNKYPVHVVCNGGFKFPDHLTAKYDGVRDYELVVSEVERNGFELGGIEVGANYYDEFIHLMDTCVVHDQKMFDMMFDEEGSVYLCRGFYSYLGKYRTDILKKVGVPQIDNKKDAIFHEHSWHTDYRRADPLAKPFQPELPVTTDVFEQKHGRNNMVIANSFITKWKGTWS